VKVDCKADDSFVSLTPGHRQALQQAVALQQRGGLREAEKIYSPRAQGRARPVRCAQSARQPSSCKRGQAGRAYRLISAATRINPRVPDAWVNLGVVLHALKRYEEALASFDKALALNPGDAGAINQRGNVLRPSGATRTR